MNSEWIKRYIYAVTSHLPAKAQAEVEADLQGMICELLDARCGEQEPTEADIRAVLTQLGPPQELAVKYSGEENKALISGIYLVWFKRLLKLVLPIAAAGVAFATLISAFTEWQPSADAFQYSAQLFAEVVSGAVSGAMQAFVWVFVILAILEHKKVKLNDGDFLSALGPVPVKQSQIKLHEPILNIFWHIASAALFLGFPYLIGGYTESTGWVPAFSQSYIQGAWYLVVAWAVVGIASEVFTLTERRYSKRLALVTVVANLLTGTTAVLFFANKAIMNPAFNSLFDAFLQENSIELAWKIPSANLLLLGIILFALVLDAGVTTYRALRYDRAA